MKVYNLARMATATTGTGTITLGAAVSGYLTFAAAGVADGDIVRYGIKDGSNSEVGYGSYTASGTTLTRNVETSTNANSAISLSGSAEVYITVTRKDFLTVSLPQGRLTLVSATPVMTASQTAKTTVYYTPYAGQYCPLYDGSSFTMHDLGGELSQATTDTTKSPAAVTANSNFDLFVWLDGTTYRCTRGPTWSSDTSRGSGAGTTELIRQNGIWLNKNAITNGPAASRGTYVGTVRSNGSGQIDWNLGAAGSGGVAGFLGVWNLYNRAFVAAQSTDTSPSWTYSSGTNRQADNSSGNRISFVTGLDVDAYYAQFDCGLSVAGGGVYAIGLLLNGTSGFTVRGRWGNSSVVNGTVNYFGPPVLGFNFIQATESGDGANTGTLNPLGTAYTRYLGVA
jgi:hypothetical protein